MKKIIKIGILLNFSLLILFIGFITINIILKVTDNNSLQNIYLTYGLIVASLSVTLIVISMLSQNNKILIKRK